MTVAAKEIIVFPGVELFQKVFFDWICFHLCRFEITRQIYKAATS